MEAIHRRFVDRIKTWISAHPKETKVLIGVGLLAVVALVMLWPTLFPAPQPSAPAVQHTEEKPEPVKYYSPLTGVQVPAEKNTKAAVTGIMIENSPDARPQSGLKEAGVVYEAIAEGGITRFLTLYQEKKPKLIGPVRSVRLYYVDWWAPFDASIAHVGGSAFALREVRSGKYVDLDQFFNSQYYWRATDRWAPHNVYTNFVKLNAANRAKKHTTSKFTSWPRTDEKSASTKKATKINVTVSGPLFNSTYVYDKAKNRYNRSQAGAAHMDREKGRITPSVVIVMYTQMTRVFEDGYRESIKTSGSGKVYVFQDGKVIGGTWKKKNRAGQIQFLDKKGEPIELTRGQTWITAVPANQGGKVTWK